MHAVGMSGQASAGGARFPSTHWSSILRPAAGDPSERATREALEALARTYWWPIYACLRRRWNRPAQEAEDLTQEFFLSILESPFLQRADPSRGRFRNFVRTHLDHFMLNQVRGDRCLRRGGGRAVVSIHVNPELDGALSDPSELSPDAFLDREWTRAVVREAVVRLERILAAEGQAVLFDVLRRYDLDAGGERPPTYAEVAEATGVAVTDVTNFLSRARRRLYEVIRDVVAESVDGEEALREELDSILSVVRS